MNEDLPRSRGEALKSNSKRFIGRPCRRCGGTLKHTVNSGCIPCTNARHRVKTRKERPQACISCGTPVSPEGFYEANQSTCKGCLQERHKGYMQDKSVAYRLWVGAHSRAAKKGLPFDLEVADIEVPEKCPVFGVPMERATGSRGAGDSSPTLDKIIPELGYVKGNVAVISWKANRLKSNGTLDDFRALTRWLSETVK